MDCSKEPAYAWASICGGIFADEDVPQRSATTELSRVLVDLPADQPPVSLSELRKSVDRSNHRSKRRQKGGASSAQTAGIGDLGSLDPPQKGRKEKREITVTYSLRIHRLVTISTEAACPNQRTKEDVGVPIQCILNN